MRKIPTEPIDCPDHSVDYFGDCCFRRIGRSAARDLADQPLPAFVREVREGRTGSLAKYLEYEDGVNYDPLGTILHQAVNSAGCDERCQLVASRVDPADQASRLVLLRHVYDGVRIDLEVDVPRYGGEGWSRCLLLLLHLGRRAHPERVL